MPSFSILKRFYVSLKHAINYIMNNWIIKFNRQNIIKVIKKSPFYSLIAILLIFYLIYKVLERSILLLEIGAQRIQYGVLKPCFRCCYGKSRERIIIVSGGGYGNRKGKVLMILDHKNNKVYSNRGDCLGINNCNKCIDSLSLEDLPCKFKELRRI